VGTNGVCTSDVDFSSFVEGETLTILEGSNAGTFRIERLLGAGGGFPGNAPGPATSLRVALVVLKTETSIVFPGSGFSYIVSLERLGVQKPKVVIGEDVSSQFW